MSLSKDIRYKVKEGDVILVQKISFIGKEKLGEPYKAIVLWTANQQPLITKCNKYCPEWIIYDYIIDIVGHVDLYNLFTKIYPDLLKVGD